MVHINTWIRPFLLLELRELCFSWNFISILRKIILYTLIFIAFAFNAIAFCLWDLTHPKKYPPKLFDILVFSYTVINVMEFLAHYTAHIVYIWKWHVVIGKMLLRLLERCFYNNLYKYQPLPAIAYKLMGKYNIKKCIFCCDTLSNHENCTLICGHLYHEECLRKWELHQFDIMPIKSYLCAYCRIEYNWQQKFALKTS